MPRHRLLSSTHPPERLGGGKMKRKTHYKGSERHHSAPHLWGRAVTLKSIKQTTMSSLFLPEAEDTNAIVLLVFSHPIQSLQH